MPLFEKCLNCICKFLNSYHNVMSKMKQLADGNCSCQFILSLELNFEMEFMLFFFDSEVPSCFYPPNYQLYTVQSLKQHDQGFYLTLLSQEQSGWPRDVTQLAVNITIETNYRIHFKVII